MDASEKTRQSNFELARVVLIFMVVGLHTLLFGGALYNLPADSLTLRAAYFLESLFIIAVNGFVMISGYFQVTSEFRVKKLIRLYIPVLFYSVVLSALYFVLTGKGASPKDVFSAVFPLLTKRWWFFSTYIALYVISPFLNRLLLSLDARDFRRLVLCGVALFSVWPTLSSFAGPVSPLYSDAGYGFVYFVLLYSVGAYLRLHYRGSWNKWFYLLAYFLCCAVTYLLSTLSLKNTGSTEAAFRFWNYDSVSVLFATVFFILFFRGLSFRSETVNRLGRLTFGVYLIHEHPQMRSFIFSVVRSDAHTGLYFLPFVLLSALAVVLACAAVEELRLTALGRAEDKLLGRLPTSWHKEVPIVHEGTVQPATDHRNPREELYALRDERDHLPRHPGD